MLKNILIKCTEIMGRDDLSEVLKNSSDVDLIENQNAQNDVLRLINFFNYTTNYVAENYLDLMFNEKLKTDSEGKLYYYNFCFAPVRIFSIISESGKHIQYEITPNYVLTKSPHSTFSVTYKYTPNECSNLESMPDFPKNFNIDILCYGIVSEFLASKSQLVESEFWKKKFLNRLFKSKLQRERRLKSTFLR